MELASGLKISEDWSITNDKNVLGKIAFGLCLYFWEDKNKIETRQAVLDIFEDYRKIVNPQFRWTTNPVSDAFKRLTKGVDSYITPDQWVLKADDYGWGFTYHGGKYNIDASDLEFAVSVHGTETSYKGFGDLFCHFPLGTFEKADLDPVEVFAKWCSWLKPVHGYSGCFLALRQNHTSNPYVYDMQNYLAFTLPGLQINEVIEQFFSLSKAKQIKGVDWLTIISSSLLADLGGAASVKAQMEQSGLRYQAYDGGLILVAGERPTLGSEGLNDPELDGYYKVAAIVEPIRIKNHSAFHPSRVSTNHDFQRIDVEKTQAWLARFSPKR